LERFRMTIATAAPDVDELMPAARELAAQKRDVPSKRTIQDALSIGFPRASKIHDQLRTEHAERRAEKRRRFRAVAARKRPSRAAADRFRSTAPAPVVAPVEPTVLPQVAVATDAPPPASVAPLPKRVSRWWLPPLAAPAFVAIWAGWVDLGRLTGFGVVHPLPGIADRFSINTAITLPIGLEAYAAYAMSIWLSRAGSARARRFAGVSAIASLLLGFAGQAAYHLMIAAGMTVAPWPITLAVSGVPVAVLGMGAALWHLVHTPEENSCPRSK
jgi:hypothetical protein